MKSSYRNNFQYLLILIMTVILVFAIFIAFREETLPKEELITIEDEEKTMYLLENNTPITIYITNPGWGKAVINNPQKVLEIWGAITNHFVPVKEQEEIDNSSFILEIEFLNGDIKYLYLPPEYMEQQEGYTESILQ